jgi:zinc protease
MKMWIKRALRIAMALTVFTAGPAYAGPKIDHWVTASGARVFFVETRALPMLDVQVAFAAGGAYDPQDKAGLSGLTRGLLRLGAGGLDEKQIGEKLADLGAQLGTGGDDDRATVSLRTLSDPAQRLPAVELMARVLQQPDFPETVLSREKKRAITNLEDSLTRPDTLAARAFSQAIYGQHPYGMVATPESIDAVSRDDLVAFYRAHYAPTTAVVTLVGHVSRAEAEAIARKLTDGLPRNPAARALPPVTPPSVAEIRIAHPAAQAHVLIGSPVMRRGDTDYFPLVLGNYTLGGGGFVSRLMQEVREKRGLAYSVYSYFAAYRDAGPLQLGLQTKREQTGEALAVARNTLAKFLADGPSAEELAAAKANLVGGFPLRLDSSRKLLENVAVIGFYDLPLDWLDTYRQKMQAVSAADIRDAFARRVRPENLITVIVGPE